MVNARRAAQWVVGIGAGTAWAARRLVRTSTFFDEWTLVEQAISTSPWRAAWASFNGHLWLFQDAVYRTQLLLGGVQMRWPVVLLQLLVLASLHVAITRVARRVGVPLPVALLLGLAVVYMGVAPQNWLFVVQWAVIASMALAVTACGVIAGGGPDGRRSTAVALLLLGAVVVESGSGTVSVAMVAGAGAVLWGRRAVVPLLPAAGALLAWYSFADLGPEFGSTWWRQARVAGELLCRAAGGLVGLGPAAGAVLVAGLCTASWWFARQRALSAVDRGLVVAGWCGAVVAVAAIARARAGLPDLDFYDSNRYLFPVAVPLALVVAPVLRAAVSAVVSWRAQVPSRRPAAGGAWTVVAALLLAGAVAGQRVEARWATDFTAANDAVRAAVQSTSATLVACCPDGCPGGSPLPPDARPAGRWSPQVTVALVEELLRRGLLPSGPVGPDTMGAVSRAGGGGGACAGGG